MSYFLSPLFKCSVIWEMFKRVLMEFNLIIRAMLVRGFSHFLQIKLVARQANRLKPNVLAAMDKVVWFICTARNAIVVIACLIIASVLNPDIEECMVERENCTFTLTGKD